MNEIFGLSLPLWVVVPGFYILWIFSAWTLKGLLFIWLTRLARKSNTQLDDILIASLNIPLAIMIFVWGTAVLFHAVVPHALGGIGDKILVISKIATILSAIIFVDLFISKALDVYAGRIQILKTSQSFASFLIHFAVWGLGALIALDSFGISITPIIASLGIGSLAVALALQPTLENVFAGVQIILDKIIQPGQFIKLESGDEGFVERIGWRSTWVRQLSNNMVIIPNKQLVNARLINYHYPTADLAVTVDVGVHYSSDLDLVEKITAEIGADTLRSVTGGDSQFQPVIRFHTLAGHSINMTVTLRAKEYTDSFLIKHEFIKKLVRRYASEGIVLPYPITALNTSQEKAAFSKE